VLYQIVRSLNEWYPLAVLWMYIGALLLALAMMFIFPQGTILLMFLGLAGLAFVAVGWRLLQWTMHALARGILTRGLCPNCKKSASAHDPSSDWTCVHCGATFSPRGVQLNEEANQPAAAPE
jgi:ribosomal protein L37AE/L43A